MKKLLLAGLLATTAAHSAAWAPLDILNLTFSTLRFSITESIPQEITIKATGVGQTQTEAVEQANNDAVQRAIGMLVLSEQSAENNTVLRNVVASYSSGVVNSYTIDTCNKDKFVTCTVTAKVSPWKFMRKLQGDSKTIQVNGDDLFMRHQTSKVVLQQREKMTEYYFSHIQQSGLDVKISEVKIQPTLNDSARLIVSYEVVWNREFKEEMIRYLEKLQKDTDGEVNNQVYIQWGPTGFFDNRVHINTHNSNMKQMMLNYMHQPVYVKFKELGICQKVESPDVFKIDWYDTKGKVVVDIDPNRLKNVNKLSAKVGCS